MSVGQIIYPYRPDILIRVDFLEWFGEVRNQHFGHKKKHFNPEDIFRNNDFFEEAKKHPYFLQFTRKRKYRKLNLPKKKSEIIYADGIASFINLLESINKKGFDKNNKIGLIKAPFIKSPLYGEKHVRDYYMGDGCHRLSCLLYSKKQWLYSQENFNIKFKFFYRPVNSFGIMNKLKICNESDEQEFNKLFTDNSNLDLDHILNWTIKIRNRFSQQNIDELFKIQFNN